MALTDYMCQEMKEEENLPALRTANATIRGLDKYAKKSKYISAESESPQTIPL